VKDQFRYTDRYQLLKNADEKKSERRNRQIDTCDRIFKKGKRRRGSGGKADGSPKKNKTVEGGGGGRLRGRGNVCEPKTSTGEGGKRAEGKQIQKSRTVQSRGEKIQQSWEGLGKRGGKHCGGEVTGKTMNEQGGKGGKGMG